MRKKRGNSSSSLDLALKQLDPLTSCPPTTFHPFKFYQGTSLVILQTVDSAPGCAFSAEIPQRQA